MYNLCTYVYTFEKMICSRFILVLYKILSRQHANLTISKNRIHFSSTV
jgi:hypothetical protein